MKQILKNILFSRPVTRAYCRTLGRGADGTGMKPLFVFSHMRSGSSLFSHLLFTHPEIHGFGESFVKYGEAADLQRLPVKILSQSRRLPNRETYVLDKILHSHLVQWDGLFDLESARYLFLLREPESAMQSLLRAPTLEGWHQNHSFNKGKQDPAYIGGYLDQRLKDLGDWAGRIGDRSKMLYLSHDQVIERTDEVFDLLQSFLGVGEGFSEHYHQLRTTGKPGAGDPSEHIKSGKINRRASEHREKIAVDADLMEGIRATHGETVSLLRGACLHLPAHADSR